MKKLLIITNLVLISIISFGQAKPDTVKVQQPDSVAIHLSLQEYQSYMSTLSEAIRLSREAKKASEAATITVFLLQISENLQEKAKLVYKPKTK